MAELLKKKLILSLTLLSTFPKNKLPEDQDKIGIIDQEKMDKEGLEEKKKDKGDLEEKERDNEDLEERIMVKENLEEKIMDKEEPEGKMKDNEDLEEKIMVKENLEEIMMIKGLEDKMKAKEDLRWNGQRLVQFNQEKKDLTFLLK